MGWFRRRAVRVGYVAVCLLCPHQPEWMADSAEAAAAAHAAHTVLEHADDGVMVDGWAALYREQAEEIDRLRVAVDTRDRRINALLDEVARLHGGAPPGVVGAGVEGRVGG